MIPLQDLLSARLMRRVAIGMEKEDRDRGDTQFLEALPQRDDLRVIERRAHRAIGHDALIHLKAQRPLDQRLVLFEEEIIGIRPIDAADLIDVAETLRGDERRLGAGALKQGIDRDGGAVEEEARLRVVGAGLRDAGIDAIDQPRRGCEALAEKELAGFLIEGGDIRESATDIRAEPQASAQLRCVNHEERYPTRILRAKLSERSARAQLKAGKIGLSRRAVA